MLNSLYNYVVVVVVVTDVVVIYNNIIARQAEFYLCGPDDMTRDLFKGLVSLGVAEDNITYHCFGPRIKTN